MADPLEEADELFEVEPEKFTAARNALVKRLKSEGRSEVAARIAPLRRPSITTWAVNQLARRHGDLIENVIGAGDRLRSATEQVITGDRSGFQQAQADERAAIERAVAVAAGVLPEGGGKDNEAARQRMTETLRAASVVSDIADQLRRGVLEADASAPGFGLEGLSTFAAAPSEHEVRSSKERSAARKREHEVRIAELEAEAQAAAARFESSQAAAQEAAARAAELREQSAVAERDLELVRKRLDQERTHGSS